jgi:hypothetical protein
VSDVSILLPVAGAAVLYLIGKKGSGAAAGAKALPTTAKPAAKKPAPKAPAVPRPPPVRSAAPPKPPIPKPTPNIVTLPLGGNGELIQLDLSKGIENSPGGLQLAAPLAERSMAQIPRGASTPTRSPVQAAKELLTYVKKAGVKLGSKGSPNKFVALAQADMGMLKPDGIYGPQTRQRGIDLLGVQFPARK